MTVRRERVKDAVNTIWWLSKDPHPKANNRNVLKPYSDAMNNLLKNGYKAKLRPSGHNISKKFKNNKGGAIPPNIIDAQNIENGKIGDLVLVNSNNSEESGDLQCVNVISASNTSSNDYYQKRCKEEEIKRHPARFPQAVPEFFINLCTETGDIILDPFSGSNMTGRVAETLRRNWLSFEIDEEYMKGSKFRFEDNAPLYDINWDVVYELLGTNKDYIDEFYTLTSPQKYFILSMIQLNINNFQPIKEDKTNIIQILDRQARRVFAKKELEMKDEDLEG